MYWVYDLPNWLFGVLSVAAFVTIGVGGLCSTRGWAKRLHGVDRSHNDIVSFYFAAVTVFYGITLGLLAVGAWTTYSDVQGKVDHEANALEVLYRDAGAFPDPVRSVLQEDLRRYARQVIDIGWPLQRKGVVPNNATIFLNALQEHLLSFEPANERQKIIAAETYREFNDLTASRRARLDSVTAEMPGPLWTLVIVGALICLAVTLFFRIESFRMHLSMTFLFSALLGLMIYLIAVLDNPYRGKVSVTPEPLEQVYRQIMSPGK